MKNATQWPKDFTLDSKKKDYATKHGIDFRKVDEFWEDFEDWCLANGAKYKDWDAAFRMRVRKAKQWGLFQGPAKMQQVPKVAHQDKLQRAFNALIQTRGQHINNIKRRLGLSDYEVECALMAYNGGPQNVKKLASGMLQGV